MHAENPDPAKAAMPYVFPTLTEEELRHKGRHLSVPVEPIDLEKIRTIADLLDAFSGTSIQARNLGACAKVLEKMLTDPERPTILLGLAGPLIAAGLRKVIRDMIVHNMVDVVVSTGAILYQDLYQARGFRHYRGTPNADDGQLRRLYIDRIYDVYVDEDRFWETDCWVGRFADTLPEGRYSSRQFLHELGGQLDDPNSVLVQARKHGVPLFSPALNDSSIGIGLTEHYHRKTRENRTGVILDSIRDNYELTQIVVNSPCTAAIYVAGGVPKNYVNDSVVMAYIFGKDTGGHRYALQVTTDVPHWGGLSGSTLSEAMSWGKVHWEANTAMAFVEPSVSLPLIVGSALQKGFSRKRPRLRLKWENDILRELSPADSRRGGAARAR